MRQLPTLCHLLAHLPHGVKSLRSKRNGQGAGRGLIIEELPKVIAQRVRLSGGQPIDLLADCASSISRPIVPDGGIVGAR